MALRDELMEEREQLAARKESLERRIRLIDQLLDEYSAPQRSIPGVPRPEEASGEAANGHQGGIRDGIRSVLGEKSPRGQKPSEVSKVLERRGFRTGGTTPLNTRVQNEMWRMAKKGELRRQKGRYYLKREAGASSSG